MRSGILSFITPAKRPSNTELQHLKRQMQVLSDDLLKPKIGTARELSEPTPHHAVDEPTHNLQTLRELAEELKEKEALYFEGMFDCQAEEHHPGDPLEVPFNDDSPQSISNSRCSSGLSAGGIG